MSLAAVALAAGATFPIGLASPLRAPISARGTWEGVKWYAYFKAERANGLVEVKEVPIREYLKGISNDHALAPIRTPGKAWKGHPPTVP